MTESTVSDAAALRQQVHMCVDHVPARRLPDDALSGGRRNSGMIFPRLAPPGFIAPELAL